MGPNFVLSKGFQATTAIGQFRAVMLTANDQIKQADTAAALCIGVAEDDVNASDANKQIVSIVVLGIARCVNGTAGALARGVKVATDNQGRVVLATTGQAVLGITMIAATAVGDQVDVLLTPGAVA